MVEVEAAVVEEAEEAYCLKVVVEAGEVVQWLLMYQ